MTGSSGRFRPVLVSLLLLGLAGQVAMLSEFQRKHPAAEFPWADGEVYWHMAGRMAQGHWLGDTPFLSAPLYPYLLGVLRWLGLGLPGVYALQVGIHLLATAVVAVAAKRRFGVNAGLVAAGLYLLLADVAVSTMRVLQNEVQLLVTALLWWRWILLAEERTPRWRDVAIVAGLLGLLVLTFPTAVLVVPVLGAWLACRDRWSRTGWMRAGLLAVVVSALISPATIHNAIVAHEFIPISAHAGVTLLHGNQPDSRGVLTQIPGVVHGRLGLHDSAAALFERATGRSGTFGEIDRFFERQVIRFWTGEPLGAARLFAVKAYRFLTGDVYDDTAPLILDRRFGLATWTMLAPLEVPWLMGLAGVGVWAWGRVLGRARWELFIEAVLIGLPLLVTVIFFYSPRYRLPAVPPLCGLAACGLMSWRRFGAARTAALALAVSVPLLTVVNRWTGFDRPEYMLNVYRLTLAASHVRVADQLTQEKNLPAAQARIRAALDALPGYPPALERLRVVRTR